MPTERAIDPRAVAHARQRMLTPRSSREAVRILGCLCDLTRLKIVRALQAGALAASDIALVIERSRTATSQHLRVLRECGAIRAHRERNVLRYRLTEEVGAQILEAVATAFDRLERTVTG